MEIKYLNLQNLPPAASYGCYGNAKHTTKIQTKNGVTYITFPIFEGYDIVHAFSTRLGGVSTDHLGTMNLSFHRGDDPEAVMENHTRLAMAVGYDAKKLVFSDQVHKTRIYKVTENDAGKGIVRTSDIVEIDGLMTDVPEIPLMTFYADCVPVFFYDKMNHVAAMNHSGWKGTVSHISACMLSEMKKEYGTNPADVVCAIGPSICKDCYEVSVDVVEQFQAAYASDQFESMITAKVNNKYLLDLHLANYYNLINAGILPEHIAVTDICTCCNPEFLFSHRASHGMRGNLGAVIMLKERM